VNGREDIEIKEPPRHHWSDFGAKMTLVERHLVAMSDLAGKIRWDEHKDAVLAEWIEDRIVQLRELCERLSPTSQEKRS
jgi:hypothetical protein